MGNIFSQDLEKFYSSFCNSICTNNDDIKKELEYKQEQEDMEWLDNFLVDAHSKDRNIYIILSFCKEIIGENVMSRIINPKQHKAARIWGKLCHRCDISYPLSSGLKTIDINDDILDSIQYAVRHAIASYPPSFVAVLGLLETDSIGLVLTSTSRLLKYCFDIDESDIIINNVSNNLILDNIINKTHEPSFYLCVDHKRLKIILSIRGTSSIYDALTDVHATSMKYSSNNIDGRIHKVTKDLMKLCKKYQNYSLLITGHSLGAGISSLLGLMYNDKNNEMILKQLKQNKLKIYSFASPCIASKEFVDKYIGHDFINTVVLTTDIITRLSIEAIKKQNIRFDLIAKCSTKIIEKAIINLKDDKNTKQSKSAQLIDRLRNIKAKHPKQELYPIGKILWFVPNVVINDDIENRRIYLMGLKSKQTINDNKDDDNKSNGWKNKYKTPVNALSLTPIIGSKHKVKYNASNYILCDATNCTQHIFGDMVSDLPESLYAHMPNRYIWACNAKMKHD